MLRNGTYTKIYTVRIDGQTARQQPTKKITLRDFISSLVSPRNSLPGRPSYTEPALSFRCQINGFATLYKGVVMFEPGWAGLG